MLIILFTVLSKRVSDKKSIDMPFLELLNRELKQSRLWLLLSKVALSTLLTRNESLAD